MQLGEGLTSFNKDNSANFSGEKKYNELFVVYIFGNTQQKLSVKFRLLKSAYDLVKIKNRSRKRNRNAVFTRS